MAERNFVYKNIWCSFFCVLRNAKSRFLLFITPAPEKRGRFLLYVEVNKLNTGILDALVKKHSASCTFYNNSVENIAPCTGPPLRTEIRCKYSYITFQARQPNWLSGLFCACLFEYARWNDIFIALVHLLFELLFNETQNFGGLRWQRKILPISIGFTARMQN